MASAHPPLPNFFLAGAPKAGTTSLYYHLRQHPQVFLSPVKEPDYFASEVRLENFTPQPHSFRSHIAEGLRASTTQLSLYHPFLEYGLYADQVQRFFACFPRQQVRIWLYEDTLADPARFLREVHAFLGIDPIAPTVAPRRFHQLETPRALALTQPLRRSPLWPTLRTLTPAPARTYLKRFLYHQPGCPPRMNSEDRALLLEYYHENIRRLERVIVCDLHRWYR